VSPGAHASSHRIKERDKAYTVYCRANAARDVTPPAPDLPFDVAAVAPRPYRPADGAAWGHQTFGLGGRGGVRGGRRGGAGGAGHLAAALALASSAERFASFLSSFDEHRPDGRDDDRLETGFALANRRLSDRGEFDPRWRGPCASAVAARLAPGAVRVVHAGTCRAYLLRAGALARLTDDHSLGRELGAGATARALFDDLRAAAAARREARGGGADATAADRVRRIGLKPAAGGAPGASGEDNAPGRARTEGGEEGRVRRYGFVKEI
jgi:hypothetical protein